MLFLRKKYLNKIKKFLPNKNSLILVWPRQVWKSSLIKILIQEKIIENFCLLNWDELQFEKFKSPKEFLEFLNFKYDILNKKFLIIDEAQKIQNIWIFIKYLVDKNKNWEINLKTIISWSWSLKIFQWITDSLIWRYDLINIYPFDFQEFLEFSWVKLEKINFKNFEKNLEIPEFFLNEIKKSFEIYKKFWWYPDVVLAKTESEKKSKLKSIYEDYLYKDIAFLLKNKDFISFEKFLKIIASKIWSLISLQNIAEELWIKRNIVEKFFDVLKSSFLFSEVKPFAWWKVLNEIKKQKKYYIVDLWMLNYLLWIFDFSWDFKWKIIENFVFNEISVNKEDYKDIYFWQNRNLTEIDFLLIDKFDKKISTIEVKSWKKDVIPRSMLWFLDKYWEFIDKNFITSDWVFKKRSLNLKEFEFIDYRFFWIYLFEF